MVELLLLIYWVQCQEMSTNDTTHFWCNFLRKMLLKYSPKCTLNNMKTLNGVIFHLFFMISLMMLKIVNNLKTKARENLDEDIESFWQRNGVLMFQVIYRQNTLNDDSIGLLDLLWNTLRAMCTYLLLESPTNQTKWNEIFWVSKI